MNTSTQLISPSTTLLEGESNIKSGVSPVKEAPCIFRDFSHDNKMDCARPSAMSAHEFQFLTVESV